MDRREALGIMSLFIGGTIVGAEAFLSGCQPTREKPLTGILNEKEIALMDEIGECILPETKTSPGAKEVKIGAFINTIVCDCYSPQEQSAFMEGIDKINKLCRKKFGKIFNKLLNENRNGILEILANESRTYKSENGIPHYFEMIHQLVTWGYLSSEKVMVDVLGYIPVPGRYDGCIPYKPGDKINL